MNSFISRLMKKKQKMEENITDKEKEMDFTSHSPQEKGMDMDLNNPHYTESGLPGEAQDEIPSESDSKPAEENSSSVEKYEKEIAELKDKYVRLYAEFDNFKRRTSKERSDLFKTANKEVLVSLLPVLDDLERARKSFDEAKDIGPIKEGVDLITSKFKNIVAQQGITEIKSMGEPFNTDLHEAITNVPAPSENQRGKVIDVMEKGYMLNDKVIRFAKVIVGV